VLTTFDDFPIHPGSQPIAYTSTSDPNHYDRYFFNGYQRDGSLYFALAMGLYPNRHVCDAAFSVMRNGEQVNVYASRRAPADRRDATVVGPISVEVREGLRILRVTVDAPEHGLRADVTFENRTAAIEEPHFFRRSGQRVVMDYTRLTQFGTWTGWIEVDGERTECRPDETWGSRDRSWGIRPVGERYGYGAPTGEPQFYWLWAPVNFEECCTHFDVNELSDGNRWHEEALIVPLTGDPAAVAGAHYEIAWRPGTRHASGFLLTFEHSNGTTTTLSLEPIVNFQMAGLGYGHPDWGHGTWKGEQAVGGDRWSLPIADPSLPHHIHIQALSDATLIHPDGRVDRGMGILEQFVIGPHVPTGLSGVFSGA
jgi:hypothetical protein